MTYADWLRQVDDALRANQRGFTHTSIDPAALQSAYAAGQSPIVFARSAVPSAQVVYQQAAAGQPYGQGHQWANQVPTPNTFVCSVTYRALSFVGWFIWVIGFLNLLLLCFGAGFGLAAQKDPQGFSGYIAFMITSWPFVVVALIVWFAFGGICHWFSQMLAINYHKR